MTNTDLTFRIYVGTEFSSIRDIDSTLPTGTVWDLNRIGEGVWNDEVEPNFILDVFHMSDLTANIAAYTLAARFNQDAVLVLRELTRDERGRTMASPTRYGRHVTSSGNRTLFPGDTDHGYRYERWASGPYTARLITKHATSEPLT